MATGEKLSEVDISAGLNDADISCKGIDLMVNNDWDGCEALFAKYKYVSVFLDSAEK